MCLSLVGDIRHVAVSLVVDCLSPTVGQGYRVRSSDGVCIRRLGLVEVGPTVLVVDAVLKSVRLGRLLVRGHRRGGLVGWGWGMVDRWTGGVNYCEYRKKCRVKTKTNAYQSELDVLPGGLYWALGIAESERVGAANGIG